MSDTWYFIATCTPACVCVVSCHPSSYLTSLGLLGTGIAFENDDGFGAINHLSLELLNFSGDARNRDGDRKAMTGLVSSTIYPSSYSTSLGLPGTGMATESDDGLGAINHLSVSARKYGRSRIMLHRLVPYDSSQLQLGPPIGYVYHPSNHSSSGSLLANGHTFCPSIFPSERALSFNINIQTTWEFERFFP